MPSSRVLLFLMFLGFAVVTKVQGEIKIFDVTKYGAIGDGRIDNTKAFFRAWNDACKWDGNSGVLIPRGTFLLGTITFTGPCKKSTAFQIKGVIRAPSNLKRMTNPDQWIGFRYVDRLLVNGRGTVDGQGDSAWSFNSCAEDPNCPSLPISMVFNFVTNSRISGITSVNSKNAHISLYGCHKVSIDNIKITAPYQSPNTDGIKIGDSKGIKITHSSIGTGDDCIALLSGSTNINVTDVTCGPGHGISVGSLGRYANERNVHGLAVRNCTFRGTTNGVRIKTWASPQANVASGFTFENIFMSNVENPIVIDQMYCPHGSCNQKITSNVQIKDVTYRNIWGTSSTKVAVNFQCSKTFPCENIVLQDIYLVHNGRDGAATSSCNFVDGDSYGTQKPPSCL
ncbi:Pectin lyase-like superfamily protein [Citrus sinensis]|uniref:Pectin lyase-like superfamily protein n=2 Tax=Citrus sinensis TaxID=2711 RepID=A0ACB8M1R3_CITSI|nr:Pectin lyase-like superfamily protein [Citrus sinensis]